MRGLFGALAKSAEFKVTDASDLTWAALLGSPSSKAGVAVNIETALRVSTVLACVRVLAEGVAQLPLKVYRVDPKTGSKTPATDLPVYDILARRPNEFQTSFEMREMMMFHAVLTGNAYAYTGRGGIKRDIQEIIPLTPNRVRVTQDVEYGLLYHVADLSGREVTLTSDEIFHLRGPSWNGYLGMDALHLAREAVGLAIATEESHARLFANGAAPGGVLSVDGNLSKESKQALRDRVAEQIEGLHNRFKTLVLDQSAKWQSMAMTGAEAQQIETRGFQVEEVCRAMRVFPQMVMHTDKTSTFASAEQFFLAHVTHSLMPWLVRWEHMIEHNLLADQDDLIAKFSVAALLRGDATQRASFYQAALGGARPETAYMTKNEVRALEELNPLDGGDTLPPATPPAPPPAPGAT